MRTLVVLAVVLAVAYAERCEEILDCHHVVCGAGWHIECHERECTCLAGTPPGPAGGTNCTQQSDCHCDKDAPHCVDGVCRCGFRPGGGK